MTLVLIGAKKGGLFINEPYFKSTSISSSKQVIYGSNQDPEIVCLSQGY